jgi:hypothetical protein
LEGSLYEITTKNFISRKAKDFSVLPTINISQCREKLGWKKISKSYPNKKEKKRTKERKQ